MDGAQVPYHDLGGRAEVQVWDVNGPEYIKVDWRDGERFRASISLNLSKFNTLERMLFNVALPMDFATECRDFFNERLTPNGKDEWNRKTTTGEVVRSWGYYVALALNPSVAVEESWRTTPLPGDLFPPLAMGKHGLTKNRFKKMRELQGQMFSKDEDGLDENDPWRYCRAPVRAFNDRRRRLIVPSWLLDLDESMCAWTGAVGVEAGKGANFKPIPWSSYVERKPEPLGAEIKVAADGEVGVFLHLELQEGAEAHVLQPYYDEYGHTSAVSLRLLEPWFRGPRRAMDPWFKGPSQPSRACYGDSWFMGLNAAEAIFLTSGKAIFPFGDVKTNTSRMPMDELKKAVGPDSGDWATFTTELHLGDDTRAPLMAVGHRRGPEVHTFISMHGKTTRGVPQKHKDDDTDLDTGYVIARKCPAVLNDATVAQPKIDRGNRRRQYDLAMEKRFRTEAFPFRLFTTVLGIELTDCYYLDQYFNKNALKFREACHRMAWAMMHNNIDEIAEGKCAADELYRAPEELVDGASPYSVSPSKGGASCVGHIAVPMYCIPGYDGGKQQNCVVCVANGIKGTMKTTYACLQCSTKDYVVPLHPPYWSFGKPSGWKCQAAHRRAPEMHRGTRPNVKKEKKKGRAGVDDDEEGAGEDDDEEGEECEECEECEEEGEDDGEEDADEDDGEEDADEDDDEEGADEDDGEEAAGEDDELQSWDGFGNGHGDDYDEEEGEDANEPEPTPVARRTRRNRPDERQSDTAAEAQRASRRTRHSP